MLVFIGFSPTSISICTHVNCQLANADASKHVHSHTNAAVDYGLTEPKSHSSDINTNLTEFVTVYFRSVDESFTEQLHHVKTFTRLDMCSRFYRTKWSSRVYAVHIAVEQADSWR